MAEFDSISMLASQQHGAFTRAQWLAAGLSAARLHAAVRDGLVVRRFPTVFSFRAVGESWEQRVAAAVLGGGRSTSASHRAAVAWWVLDRYETPLVEITSDRGGRRRRDLVRVHESLDLAGTDRTLHRGIWVTTVERTLVDVARYKRGLSLAGFLDDAVRRGLTTYARVRERSLELSRRGRPGPPHLLAVLAERPGGAVPPGSTFEALMLSGLNAAGLPPHVRQQRVVIDRHRFALDFAWPASLVGVECDGLSYHSMPVDVEYDLWRQNLIQTRAGYLLLRYPRSRLLRDRRAVMTEIASAIASRAGIGALQLAAV